MAEDEDLDMAVFAFDSGDVATASGKIYFCHPTQGICIIDEMLLREAYVARIVLRPLHQKSLRADNFRRLDFSEFSRLGFRVEFVFSSEIDENQIDNRRIITMTEDGHVQDRDDDDGIPMDENDVEQDSLLEAIGSLDPLQPESTDGDWPSQQPTAPRRSQRSMGGSLVYECSTCGRRFSKRRELNQHMAVHSSEKPFACSKCDYRGKNLFFLKRHMRHHTGEKPFRCEECNEGFTLYQTLDRHVRKVHRGQRTRCSVNGVFKIKEFALHECVECGKDFDSRAALEHHIRIHTGDKPFPCSQCGAKFRTKDELIRHQRRHQEGRFVMEPCDECGAKVKSGRMEQHKRKHMEGAVYKCTYCSKVLYSEAKRQAHEAKFHTQEYNFQCDMCDFKCVTEWGLNSHKGKIHRPGESSRPTPKSRAPPAPTRAGPPPPLARFDDPLAPYEPYDDDEEDEDLDDPYFEPETAPALAPVDTTQAEPVSERPQRKTQSSVRRPRPIQCKDCGGKFNSTEGIELHKAYMEIGDDEQSLCKFCGKSLESNCMLRVHEITEHTKAYPFLCTFCDYGSFNRTDVEHHEKRHRNPVSDLYVPEEDRGAAIADRMNQLRQRQREKENIILRAAGIFVPNRRRRRVVEQADEVEQLLQNQEAIGESNLDEEQQREIDESIETIITATVEAE